MKTSEFCILLAIQVLGCTFIAQAQSPDLKCYKCLSQAGDNTCLDDPERVPIMPNIVDCEGGWCTTVRKEFTEVPGKIVTFTRDCALKQPTKLDNIDYNAHFTTFYSSCRTVRCNNGHGLKDSSGGGGGGDNTGFIIVNGESAGESSVKINFGLGMIFVLICVLVR